MPKTVCFTIDVEPDFGGMSRMGTVTYMGIDNLLKFQEIARKYGIKPTAFVTGKTLEDNAQVLDVLHSMKAEIEQHSYSHSMDNGSKINDIEKGIEVHSKLIGRSPLGYRAPLGKITKEEILFLQNNDIRFDSSIFPTLFPGRFNRLAFPVSPFLVGGSGIVEVPISVIPRMRIPIGLSYMQLLGFNTFMLLFKLCGLPELIVYDLHTYELGKVRSYSYLPLIPKLGYYRAQNMYEDPACIFERFVKYLLALGYQSRYMIDVYNDLKSNVTSWSWKGD